LEHWPITAIAAYCIWLAIPLAVLALQLREGRRGGGGGKPPALELGLAVAFNALLVLVIGGVALPRMSSGEMDALHSWLIAVPFLPYGLAGVAFLRRKVKEKRTVSGRAIAVYAFSTAGHLAGITLLQAYLLIASKLAR
jgi:hypothetical protein